MLQTAASTLPALSSWLVRQCATCRYPVPGRLMLCPIEQPVAHALPGDHRVRWKVAGTGAGGRTSCGCTPVVLKSLCTVSNRTISVSSSALFQVRRMGSWMMPEQASRGDPSARPRMRRQAP